MLQEAKTGFQKVTEHIYLFPHDGRTDRPNIGYVLGDKYALLFDAGNSAAHVDAMKESLSELGLPMPDFVAVSHWHWDHTFGMHAWGVPTIACRETNQQLQKMQHWAWDNQSMEHRIDSHEDIEFCSDMIKLEYPDRNQIRVVPADIVFDGHLSLDLGGVVCELICARGPHSSDSVICHVQPDRLVLLGDSDGKDLYGCEWDYREGFSSAVEKIPYDQLLLDDYLRLLHTLDFTQCVSGHRDGESREEFFQYFSNRRR